MNDPVIQVDNLWKRYGLNVPSFIRKPFRGFKKLLRPLHPKRQTSEEDHKQYALKDISFMLKPGETLGIIGRNGAGKSTLLKILAGVTPVTHGQVIVNKRVFPMIELNAGLHLDLTGRENARLLGAIMGLTRKEIESKMASIESFSELGGWLERPVRMYSSGMLARLGFSVAVNVDADILLIDEVISVGDLAFQRKCYKQIELLRKEGISIILVSHAIRQVERICSNVMMIEDGMAIQHGEPANVCHLYMETVATESKTLEMEFAYSNTQAIWEGSGEIKIIKVEIIKDSGEICHSVGTGESITIRAEYSANSLIKDPIIGIAVYTADMLLLAAFSDETASMGVRMQGEGVIECRLPDIPFLPGVYSIGITVKGRDNSIIFKGLHMSNIHIQYSRRSKQSRGFVHLEPNWNFF